METGFSCKLILYLDSVFKHKHKLIHNQSPGGCKLNCVSKGHALSSSYAILFFRDIYEDVN